MQGKSMQAANSLKEVLALTRERDARLRDKFTDMPTIPEQTDVRPVGDGFRVSKLLCSSRTSSWRRYTIASRSWLTSSMATS